MKHFTKKLITFCFLSCLFYVVPDGYAQVKRSKIDQRLLDLKSPAGSSNLRTSGKNARKASPQPQKNMETFSPKGIERQVMRPTVVNNYVVVEAIVVDDAAKLLSELEALGLRNGAAFGGIVSGWIPVDSIEKMAGLTQLRFVRPSMAAADIGSTTSQGDDAMFSDVARSQFKLTGEGNKIGVLSDSYNSLGGAPGGVASGDLPGNDNPNGYLHPVQVLEDLPAGEGIDEGRAMAEIIHDVAPGADLAFHTAFTGQAGFAQGIVDLADAGSDVIVDDIIYFAEPFFQDGIITQATDIVANRGVSYFSSAGNRNKGSYQSEFRPTTDTLTLPIEIADSDTTTVRTNTPYVFHDFDPGPGVDIFQEFVFEPGGLAELTASFQWDEPFASVCEGCPGSASDLDIFVAVEEDTGTIVYEASTFVNNIGGDAVDFASYQFDADSTNNRVYVLIGKNVAEANTPDPNIIKYVLFDGREADIEYFTFSPTSFGHNNGANTVSVGASFFFRNPLYFPDIYPLPEVNEYSSVGGNPILFNIEGSRIEPDVRVNPDVTGPDAGNTTFFIPGLLIGFEIPGTTEPDEFPQFTGTSAAAPHVAAVAALMNEAAGERLAPDRITEVLQQTATDLDDPETEGFDEGYDFKTGFGYVDAQEAVATVFDLPSVVSFTLINATTDEEIGEIRDQIELSEIEGGLVNIRADVIGPDGEVGSVLFDLEGPLEQEKTESFAPYALFGDENGDYNGETLLPGEYTLTATPYTNLRGEGEEGASFTVEFAVTRFPIAQFTLVDAATDSLIRPLTDGDQINLTTFPEATIAALPELESFQGGVEFFLNGELVQTENIAPYALAGDEPRGDYQAFDFEPGEYTLTAVPFSQGGELRGDSLSISFTVIEELEVTAFVLVNTDTGAEIGEIGDGLIPFEVFPILNIRAVVNDESVGSVEFDVNGGIFNRDNNAPYLLKDDQSDNLPPGTYTITATPYSRDNGLGTAGIPRTIQIDLEIDLGLVSFVLIDAEADEPIGELTTGDTLDVSQLPPFTIEAVPSSESVESVGFTLNGERVKVENLAPFALAGDSPDGTDYQPVDLDTGAYVLQATPYSADRLEGIAGTPLEILFVIINTEENGIPPTVTENTTLKAYPNPVARTFTIGTNDESEAIVHYTVIDNLGRILIDANVDNLSAVEVDMTPYLNQIRSAGLFLVRAVTTSGEVKATRLKVE